MPNLKKCNQQPCDAPPAWRMVAPGGYATGVLCAYHKEAWYDAREDHKTTIVEIRDSGRPDAMDTIDPPYWEDDIGLPPQPTQRVARATGRRDNPSGVDGGGESRDLTPISQSVRCPSDPAVGTSANDVCQPDMDAPQVRQYGHLDLTQAEQRALAMAPEPEVVEIRPDGIIYVPWVEVANRLDYALGIGQWALVPDGKPALQDGFMCWQFHLFVRGQWVSTAIGEHPDPKTQRMSLANRAESAKSDALVKCSKALGIFRELWSPAWRADWQLQYAERVWAQQSEWSKAGAWLWRRKDRRPFFRERPAKDQMETEYHKRRDYNDEAGDHIAAIARGDS